MRNHLLKLSLSLSFLTICANFVTVFGQTETWVPANPATVVPQQVAVFHCDGRATVFASWMFSDGGYRIALPPLLARNGQTITLDVRAETWTGGRTLAVVPFSKNFDIGLLEPGTYTLDLQSWGTNLKQLQFTISADPAPAGSIDQRCFFVSQHYRDFLSRDADGGGLAFWTSDIAQCGTDSKCLELKRINVSAAFFLSIEFRETGLYVYKIYKSALGRPPTFAEFVSDAAELGTNVVVGSNEPWVIRLDGNKILYTQRFFNRADFQARYSGLTTAQYIDKIFETQGITPSTSERNDLINSIDNCSFTIGCPTRITVLRKIVERAEFDQKVFNEAFVTMQYFGYLRRDPDFEGFQFWLNKLKQFNGNFIEAEMVKAFLSSDEYRRRF